MKPEIHGGRNVRKQTFAILAAITLQTILPGATRSRAMLPPPPPDYREVEVSTFLDRHNFDDFSPSAIAADLLDRGASLEGRQREEISIDYGNNPNDRVVIEHTTIGLPDTSVRSQRRRIEMMRQPSGWQILWVGEQYQCQPRRGHQDWSGELCS